MTPYWREKLRCFGWLIVVSLLLSGGRAIAQDNAVEVDDVTKSGLFSSILDEVDRQQKSLSEQVITFTEQIDTFFVDDENERQLNYSHIQLGYRYTHYRDKEYILEPIIDGVIHLPRTENRLTIELSSGSDIEDEGPASNAQQGRFGLGLIDSIKGVLTAKLTGGIRRVDSTFTGYINLRLYRQFLFDRWTLQLSEDLYKDSVVSRFSKTQILFERTVSENKRFGSITRNWHYFDLDSELNEQIFYLQHLFSERDALIYQLGIGWKRVLGESSNKLDNYYNLVRYSRRLHKEWLYLEISPQINYLRENDFSPEPLLMVQLTALLGNKKRH